MRVGSAGASGHHTRQVFLILLLVCCHSARSSAQSSPPLVVRALLDAVSPDSMRASVAALCDAAGTHSRMNFTPGSDSIRSFLFRRLSTIGQLTVTVDSFHVQAAEPYALRPLFNIAGIKPGNGTRNDIVVIGAHYDSQAGKDSGWYANWSTMSAPGADDNASGVAAVLEIARVMTRAGGGFVNASDLHFVAFAAEEGTVPDTVLGQTFLNGSRHYAQRLKQEGRTVRAVIILDMIGFNPAYRVGTLVADSQSQWLGNLIYGLNVADSIGFDLAPPPFEANRWSDHAPFWDERYPAVLLTEHFDVTKGDSTYPGNGQYHRSSDTAGTLNFELVRGFAQLALAAAARVSIDSTQMTSRVVSNRKMDEGLSLNAVPNPFNPATVICYTVAALSGANGSVVSVKVYDLLGREVARLVDGVQLAGDHQVLWRAGGVPSGTYVVRLSCDGRSVAAKLLLLK